MQRWQWPIHKGTSETLIWSKMLEIPLFFLTRNVFNSDNFSTASLKQEIRKPILQLSLKWDKQFKGTTTWIFNSYLIRQNFKDAVSYRALPSLHEGSFENRNTVFQLCLSRRFRKYCCECVNVFTSVHKPSAGIRSQHFPHLLEPMSPRRGDAATKNVDLSASVSNQEGILRLINIRWTSDWFF